MVKDVLISVSGMQFDSAGDDSIEVITTGVYYFKNNKHYIIFEELLDGTESATNNTIWFTDDELNLKRSGAVNVHMVFDTNKKTMNNYSTPFGNLLIGIDTSDIKCEETDDKISVIVSYALDVNYEFLSNCKLKLSITPRK